MGFPTKKNRVEAQQPSADRMENQDENITNFKIAKEGSKTNTESNNNEIAVKNLSSGISFDNCLISTITTEDNCTALDGDSSWEEDFVLRLSDGSDDEATNVDNNEPKSNDDILHSDEVAASKQKSSTGSKKCSKKASKTSTSTGANDDSLISANRSRVDEDVYLAASNVKREKEKRQTVQRQSTLLKYFKQLDNFSATKLDTTVNLPELVDKLLSAQVILEKLPASRITAKGEIQAAATENAKNGDDSVKKTRQENGFARYCPTCNEIVEAAAKCKPANCQKCNSPLVYQCLKCNKECNTYFTARYHSQKECNVRQHQEERYRCSECNYKSSVKKNFDNHIKNCQKVSVLQCQHCHFQTHSAIALKYHVESHSRRGVCKATGI